MPKKIDLTEMDDQELDLDDEEQDLDDEEEEDQDEESEDGDDEDESDEEDDEPSQKRTKRKSSSRKEDPQLAQKLDEIKQLLSGNRGTPEAKQRKVDVLLEQLAAGGKFSKDQLAVLSLFAEAVREDLATDYEADKKQMSEKQLFESADREFDRAASRMCKKHPQMKWAKGEIIKQAMNEMFKGKAFADARAQFERRILPDSEEFDKAVQRIARNYLKDHGIKVSNASEQLDVRSSRSKPATSNASKKGELDTSRLSDREKEIYFETKNATKDEDLAREALDAYRKYKRGVR